VEVCVAVNRTQEVFEISAFGGNRLYRIIYANVLYFVVIHGGPLLLIAFFNVKLIQANSATPCPDTDRSAISFLIEFLSAVKKTRYSEGPV